MCGVNLHLTHLRVPPCAQFATVGGSEMRVRLGQIVRLMGLTLGLWAGLSAGVASAANIAWVSVNADDTGQDQGFVDLLRGAGHTVTRVQRNGAGSTLTPEKIATLTASDLVIVGRA